MDMAGAEEGMGEEGDMVVQPAATMAISRMVVMLEEDMVGAVAMAEAVLVLVDSNTPAPVNNPTIQDGF